jgi:electron transfer flavoprotein alpha subunit
MSGAGVLVLGEVSGGELCPTTFELIGAALELAGQGAGSVSVVLIDAEAEAHAAALNIAGVQEILLVSSPHEHFEAHVAERALSALVGAHPPAVVLAAHTSDALAFAPAVAARSRLGFATDVTAVRWQAEEVVARRDAYGERLIAELDFPGKETVLLLLRPGVFAACSSDGGSAPNRPFQVELAAGARTEQVELREAPAGEVEIAEADFLLSIGRGVKSAERVPELERLAGLMGATLAASGPPAEAGWVAKTRKVGQSGRTVAPRVYLAMGISGAPQHLAGMSKARTIVAVNSDPEARIFEVADYGAVADLFEIAAELERLFG